MRAAGMGERRQALGFGAWASAVTGAVAFSFVRAGMAATGGEWPRPLDDVYIHYDFARALATGHPFAWIAGQGYSSGETSPLYACVLAVGYAVGFRGERLGIFSAFVAIASLLVALFELRRVVRCSWAAFGFPLLLFVSGTADFALWSGMEVALFAGVAGVFVRRVNDACEATAAGRASAQWRAGLAGAALVLVRPEAAALVAVATFVAGRRADVSSGLAACVRVALPGALATASVLSLNRVMTGDWASAGARLKLLSSNPFMSDFERARDYVVNLGSFLWTMRRDLGDGQGRLAYLVLFLAVASVSSRRTRDAGATCLLGAVAFGLLVSWNGAARYQNYRDYVPAVLLLFFAAMLGLAALAARGRVGAACGGLLTAAVVLLGGSHLGEAASYYARASKNIHDQQVTVGRRLRDQAKPDAIVLVGDAGAIPYESHLHAVDALGLGGYHGVPFVRAAVLGEAATVELVERLPPAERPTILALYPNWFPGITSRFGHETGRVTIDDNVICGGPTKGIYDADWTALRSPGGPVDEAFEDGALDEVDVADVMSEEAHAYVSPAPEGGWTVMDVRASNRSPARFDAGRITPSGEEESFAVRASAPAGASVLMRVDDVGAEARIVVEGHESETVPLLRLGACAATTWCLVRAALPFALAANRRVHVEVKRGELHDFHVWLTPGKP